MFTAKYKYFSGTFIEASKSLYLWRKKISMFGQQELFRKIHIKWFDVKKNPHNLKFSIRFVWSKYGKARSWECITFRVRLLSVPWYRWTSLGGRESCLWYSYHFRIRSVNGIRRHDLSALSSFSDGTDSFSITFRQWHSYSRLIRSSFPLSFLWMTHTFVLSSVILRMNSLTISTVSGNSTHILFLRHLMSWIECNDRTVPFRNRSVSDQWMQNSSIHPVLSN